MTYLWYNVRHPSNNTGASQTYELDHLVSLEIGGADTLENIWPQCGPKGVALRKRTSSRRTSLRITSRRRSGQAR